MSRKAPQLAKLTRPRLHHAVARERLFALLDDKREHPVVWITGPPGAGKTTVVSTYLETAKLPGVWYQLDSGDADPATFFYYLRSAAAGSLTRRKPLPLLTPEYLSDIAGFARRFFRNFFQRAPSGAVLALDNYHEVLPNSRLHAALAAAIEEVPDRSNVIVMSREEPPVEYTRARLSENIAQMSWEELRLTQEETGLIVASRGGAAEETVRLLYEQTDGWTAGVILLLERLRRDGILYSGGPAATFGGAFDYFASQIFSPAPVETRELLITAALLPRITLPLLEVMSGNPNAARVLEFLYQRHLFLDRRPGNPPTYHLHALFREFLLDRAARTLGEDSLREMRRKASDLLIRSKQEEEAIPVLLEAADWEKAESLLVKTASSLIGQGRWQTLQGWAQTLPAKRLVDNPWLQYWIARSKIAVEPGAAKAMLETAHAHFKSSGDATGQLLAAVGVLDALYFEFSDFRAMDPWIARVVELLEQGVMPPTKEDELRVHGAVMMGAANRAPHHSMLETCVQRVEALLFEPFDPNLRVSVASMLHAYGNVAVDHAAEEIAIRIARPLLNAPELTAWTAALYLGMESYTHYIHGRYPQSLACLDTADAIAAEHELKHLMIMLGNWRGLCERRAGLIDQAEATIRRIEALGAPSHGQPAAVLLLVKASVAFARGDLESASSTILASYRLTDEGRFHTAMQIGLVAANFAIAAGKTDIACGLLCHLRAQAVGPLVENYAGAIILNQAWLQLRRGDPARSADLLRESLQRAHDARQRFRYRLYGNALSELLPVALDNGIEPDIASQLIREFNVGPSGTALENWPWPVKIYTLGRFDLAVGDRAPQFSRKMPRKALLVLKALIAFGGREVPEEKLIDVLWPDQDGDAASRAFEATVHRLRVLLNDPEAIHQRGGMLSLNGKRCWVDAIAFEGLLREKTPSSTQNAIELYAGAFLAQEENAPWAMARREKLRAKFVEAVGGRAAELERTGDFEGAARHYACGLEADDLVESFYQGLMRCYRTLGRRGDALTAYRRCQQMLSAKLGAQPSPATERLFQSLRAS